MKDFLLKVTIVDGEHEHSGHALVCARSLNSAERKADKLLRKDRYGVLDHPLAYFGYGDGLTATKLDGLSEISNNDAATLVRLGVVYHV